MKLGEVCILTRDVVRLANFYKNLLGTDNGSDDAVHQTIIAEETMLTVYNGGQEQEPTGRNMCLAFTVEDIDKEYHRVVSLGAAVIEPPTIRPWGAVSMRFADPDGNIVYLRSFLKQ